MISNVESLIEMVTWSGLKRVLATKSADDLAKMRQRFGKLSDTDLDAYRFLCTQRLGGSYDNYPLVI